MYKKEINMYDDIEKKIYHDINLKVETPDNFKKTIQEALHKNKKNYSFAKIAITACCTLIIGAGIVYAGTTISSQIWKQPEKVEGFYSEEKEKEYAITQKEKDSVMSEKDARKKAQEMLEKFGHKDEKVKFVELSNNPMDYELLWNLRTDQDTTILFDANNKDTFSLNFDSVMHKNIVAFKISEKEAENTARKLCEKYGYDLSEYTHVRARASRRNIDNLKDESCIWFVDFFKQYDGIVSPKEVIHIGFIPGTNEIYLFSVNDSKYENNPVEITEKQAKDIILEKEQKINTKYPIKDINAELAIVEMNGIAYLRETNYEQYYMQKYESYPSKDNLMYRTERHIRKAYVLTITYDVPKSESQFTEFKYFSYFVDATTGEIIGGNDNYKDLKKLLYE